MTEWLLKRFIPQYQNVHDAHVRTEYGFFAGVMGIICNVLLCIAKAVVGLAAGSVSIVADAINNLSDASSNVVSLIGFRLASRPADLGHPYGHGRYEYLASLVVAVLVTAVGINLVRSGFERIIAPESLDFGWPLVVVMVVSALVKVWMYLFNHKIGSRIDSETLEATAVDSRNDAVTTLSVLACALISRATGFELDGWAGLVVGVFILVSGLQLVHTTISPLLGQAPSPELVQYIRNKILSYPGVLGTHDLMVHDYGPGRKFASAHVEMAAESDPLKSHDLIDNIEQDFRHNDNLVMTIHYDPIVTNDPGLHDLRHWVEEQARTLDPRITIHDVRRVTGPTHTNIIFDVVHPPDCPLTSDELREKLSTIVKSRYSDAICKITVDESYVSTEQ